MLTKRVFVCLLITLNVIICQKDSDEGRPYEFGFTIDGQQHRHEKKDQNGIIQGEFGFITADGVYHVTVYATDENGNFKILSMRNIRISAPLDGSPALGPISPEASKYLKKANLPSPAPSAPAAVPKPLPAAPQKFERIQEAPPPSPSTQRAPYVFTTLSTIRPACAGCGLVTTPKPGEKFVFQNPAFRNSPEAGIPVPNGPPLLANSGTPGLRSRFSDIAPDTELLPPGYNNKIVQSSNEKPSPTSGKIQSFVSPQQSFNSKFKSQDDSGKLSTISNGNVGFARPTQVKGPPSPVISSNVESAYQPAGRTTDDGIETFGDDRIAQNRGGSSGSFNNLPQVNNIQNGNTQAKGPLQNIAKSVESVNVADQVETVGNKNIYSQENLQNYPQDKFGRLIAPPIGNGPNPLLQPQEVAKLPPVMVSDNVIHVMGKKPIDIPIKDKYPGMVDGLPTGVEVKDVTNILYKFKYTVGFHGHYEKGLKDGSKIGGYFVNGRDGISRIVTYVADENGYRPKFKFINLGLDSADTPNEKTEKTFGLKDFEFVWYPVE
ncbi:unnamed protein product [Diabrotica balteata]|uniref:Protein lethal(3)malignant blood neoplasm 1 n=1 Tax=Diabrotica balteata TaxID=107213 RepID=A0A9N9SWW4_DIABA|nr:unnamed protein product [Diabrotica balteata]